MLASLFLIQQWKGMCLYTQKQKSPRPWGALVLFLYFFSVWVDREEAETCQVAHRGCSVLVVKKKPQTLLKFIGLEPSGALFAFSVSARA